MKTFFNFGGRYKEFDQMTEEEKKQVAAQFNTNSIKAYAQASGLIVKEGTA